MYLKSLHILNFKNYDDKEFSFEKGINCIIGNNGKGKTNVLDAIHYLSFTKSFLNIPDGQNILFEQPFFMIEGKFEKNGEEESVNIGLKKGQKKVIKKNKKEYEKISDHIGHFPSVMVCPQTSNLITEGSEERRRFIDSLISQFDSNYLVQLISYHRIITQRNVLLKKMIENRQWNDETLAVYDDQLVQYATPITESRRKFINEFIPVFQTIYDFISGTEEKVSIGYKPSFILDVDFHDQLQMNRGKDKALGYTSLGIHRDDLEFLLFDHSIKKFGSQGQQKTFVTALKLAEYYFLSDKMKTTPILMLDDIFDKLDSTRVKRLIQKIATEDFTQVFITDTGEQKLKSLFEELGIEGSFFEI